MCYTRTISVQRYLWRGGKNVDQALNAARHDLVHVFDGS